MSLSESMDPVNKKLAIMFDHSKKIEKTWENISKIVKDKVGAPGGDQSGTGTGTKSAFGMPAANFSGATVGSGTAGAVISGSGTPSGSRANGGGGTFTATSAGGVTSGAGTSGGGARVTVSGGGGATTNGPSSGTDSTGKSRFGGMAIAAGLGSAAWQMTPGVADIVTNQSLLFPTAFATAGPYHNKGTNQRILDGVQGGSSGVFDPVAASAAMTLSSYTMNMGKTQDNMLATAGTMYKLMGMNNVTSVQGSMALSSGTAGVANKLMSVGIQTVGANGNPKDIGNIVDQMWARWYPGGKKVSEAQLDRDIAMGYQGADLQEFFGDQPALYAMAVQMLKLKAKEGGRDGIRASLPGSNENSAEAVAIKHGMNEYTSPMVSAGDVNTTHGKYVMEASEGGLSGYVKGMNAEQVAASTASGLLELGGAAADLTFQFKTLFETLLANPTTGGAIGAALVPIKIGVQAIMPGMADGGQVRGPGGSVGDKIPTYLSDGEFVINARAAKNVGVDALHKINAGGQTFGSAFASPAQMLAGGTKNDSAAEIIRDYQKTAGAAGTVTDAGEHYDSGRSKPVQNSKKSKKSKEPTGSGGQAIVDYASQYLWVPYKKSHIIRAEGNHPSPEHGWDCSTFTEWIYDKFGYNLPNLSDDYLGVGKSVPREDIQPGDLLLWKTDAAKKTGHVSIYAGGGEHIHAPRPGRVTTREKIDPGYYWPKYVDARRVGGLNDVGEPTLVGQGGSDTGVAATSVSVASGIKDVTGMSTDEYLKWINSPEKESTETSSSSTSSSSAGSGSGSLQNILMKPFQSLLSDPVFSGVKDDLEKMFSSMFSTDKKRSGLITNPGAAHGEDLGSSEDTEVSGVFNILNTLLLGQLVDKLSGKETTTSATSETTASDTVGGPSTDGESAGGGRTVRQKPSGRLSRLLTEAGFKGKHHREAWSIVHKESGGDPRRKYTTSKESSYGLFQINMLEGDLEEERNERFRKYVPGFQNKEDLFDPAVNVRAAAYMSQKGRNWSAWSATYDPNKSYDEYAPSASHGMETVSRDGPVNVHQGEMIFPAAVAQDFRDALREALNGGGAKQPVSIHLTIDKASDEEAEQFAHKVMKLLDNKSRMERVGRS